MRSERVRDIYDLGGTVQGVGFRPTLYRLARAAGLSGWAQNRSGTVRLALEGAPEAIAAFMHRLPAGLPPHARLDSIVRIAREVLPDSRALPGFEVRDSDGSDAAAPAIPADLAMCGECRAEISDPGNRRFGYPFTTCTHCGPRYTVASRVPYDRVNTTLAVFPLCPDCQREYDDPRDRRFHAESIACPACGPRLTLLDSTREPVAHPLRAARQLLAAGKILAVRGLGGFLLAADAFNPSTLEALRARKRRPHKPFAVMARDLQVAARSCRVTPACASALQSAAAPIVILDVLPGGSRDPALPLSLLAPDSATLGVMLPYSPLHHLLFEPLPGDPVPAFNLLVMTSGNRGGEPICLSSEEALDKLSGIADAWLCHDREINLRNDDSLCIEQQGAPQVWRRARGLAPDPIRLVRPLARCVLATGAELKNTMAVGQGDRVVLSPHVGDLDTPEALEALERATRELPAFLAATPEVIACDLHPDMASTRHARALAAARSLPLVSVQHHHAHAAACLAEHGEESGLALVFDGTGYGTDASIWGAELLEVTPEGFRRLATFAPVPLPGGDEAIRRPVRQLVARWVAAGLEITAPWQRHLALRDEEVIAWTHQCRTGLNAPAIHSAGRLLDAFAVALGIAPPRISHDGQPAIRLESAAAQCTAAGQPEIPIDWTERDGMLLADWRPAFALLHAAGPAGRSRPEWALAIHHAVATAAIRMVEYALSRSPARIVALSGGVFMNRILTSLTATGLERLGLRVLLHRRVPPNDGGLSLGQAVIAGGS